MSDSREEFVKRLNRVREAKKTGTFIEKPPNSVNFIPKGNGKFFAISIWGPKGSYIQSDKNTICVHGNFDTWDESEEYIKKLREEDEPMFQHTQSVTWQLGEPLSIPLIPTPGTERMMNKNEDEKMRQWQKKQQHYAQEGMEMQARVAAAKRAHKEDNIRIVDPSEKLLEKEDAESKSQE